MARGPNLLTPRKITFRPSFTCRTRPRSSESRELKTFGTTYSGLISPRATSSMEVANSSLGIGTIFEFMSYCFKQDAITQEPSRTGTSSWTWKPDVFKTLQSLTQQPDSAAMEPVLACVSLMGHSQDYLCTSMKQARLSRRTVLVEI